MSIGHDIHSHPHHRRGMRPVRFLREERGERGRGDRGPHGPHGSVGHRGSHGRRGQARRGQLREAILTLLAEQPMHGYQIMQELESRSAGRWRPSAGSVYPTLQQLEDERLVTVDEIDGRRTFRLTDAGRQASATAALSRGATADAPWIGGRDRGPDLRHLTRELGVAAVQVARVGSPAAVETAATILADARRGLYRLLADDTSAPAGTTGAADETDGSDAPDASAG